MPRSRQAPTQTLDELDMLRARVAELEREADARRQAEEALRASEARYRRLVEGVRLIAWEFDRASKRFTFVSQHAEEILGYPLSAWREAQFWFDHLHPDDLQRAAEYCRDMVARELDHELEYRMVRADGGIVWIKDITTVVKRDGVPTTLQGVFIDITERKRADEALMASQQRYRAFIEQTSEGIWRFEIEPPLRIDAPPLEQLDHVYQHATLAECNDAMAQMYGFAKAEDIIGAPLSRLLVRSNPRNTDFLAHFVRGGYKATDVESYEMDRGGHPKVFLNNLVGIVEDGLLKRVWGTQRDVTERKRAEKALERQGQILAQIHDAIIETDLEGNVTAWNKGAERIFGYGPDEMIGGHITRLYFPDDIRFRQEHVLGPLKRNGAHEIELRMRRKSGEACYIRLSLSLLRDLNGEPYGVLGYSTDVTARREAEAALRQSEQRFQAILHNAPAAIIIKDVVGRYIEFSRQAELWTHRTRAEMLGKTVHDIFPREVADVLAADDRTVIKTGQMLQGERMVPHDDGLHTHLDIKFPLLGADGLPYAVCGISTDINERKRAEDARRESTDLQRMMLSELDHRVRNNLAALAALIDISMRDKQDVRGFAESIRGRVQAMSAVHSLLSRAHWLAVSLPSLIDALTPIDLRDAIRLSGPDVMITPRQVTALGMVLQELIANSLKYGAMSQPAGLVELHWTLGESSADPLPLELTWHEVNGPPILAKPVPGQGTELILGFVRTELRGSVHMSYPREGAVHRFKLHLDRTK